MNRNTYTIKEAAELLDGCDLQTMREQIKSDIAQGRNSQNFNAFQIGSAIKIPKKWLDKKLGIGPVLTVSDKLADALVKLGIAQEVQDDV